MLAKYKISYLIMRTHHHKIEVQISYTFWKVLYSIYYIFCIQLVQLLTVHRDLGLQGNFSLSRESQVQIWVVHLGFYILWIYSVDVSSIEKAYWHWKPKIKALLWTELFFLIDNIKMIYQHLRKKGKTYHKRWCRLPRSETVELCLTCFKFVFCSYELWHSSLLKDIIPELIWFWIQGAERRLHDI